MAKRHAVWIAWGAAVAIAYAGLGFAAYAIGPANPNGHACTLIGTGTGRTAEADSSTFRILVTSSPSGAVFFADDGPASPLQLHDRHLSTVTCSPNASAGSVTGTAELGAGSSALVGFRIDLGVPAGKGGRAAFRVRLTNGYDSGTETLTTVDLTIANHTLSRHAVARR
jgi:hypothetical protein